jgi:elongation factor P
VNNCGLKKRLAGKINTGIGMVLARQGPMDHFLFLPQPGQRGMILARFGVRRSWATRAANAGAFAVKSTDLRPGMAIKMDGNLFVITQFTHVTPGNLRAFVQVKIKNVVNGALLEKRLRSGEEIESIDLDRRPMEFLYSEASGHVFMDQESFEQISLPDSLVGDSMVYVKPNTVITVLIADGRPVAIELPNVVELQVSETPPGIKGATATNQLKEATMETGLKTRVPPFISTGELVRINTEDGSYNSRA